jgi:hypothetical protein
MCLNVFSPWTNELSALSIINYHMLFFGLTTNKAKKRWEERLGMYFYTILMNFNHVDKMRYEDL